MKWRYCIHWQKSFTGVLRSGWSIDCSSEWETAIWSCGTIPMLPHSTSSLKFLALDQRLLRTMDACVDSHFCSTRPCKRNRSEILKDAWNPICSFAIIFPPFDLPARRQHSHPDTCEGSILDEGNATGNGPVIPTVF